MKLNTTSINKKFPYTVVGLFLAVLLSALFTFVLDMNTLSVYKIAMNIASSNPEIVIDAKNFEVDGIDVNGGWVITKDSPELIIRNIDAQVDYLELSYLACEEDQRIGATLYWNDADGVEFSDTAMRVTMDTYGMPYMIFGVASYMHDAKIVLGKREGKTFQIESLVANPDLKSQLGDNLLKEIKFRTSHLSRFFEKFKVLLLFFCLLILPFVWGWDKAFKYRWVIAGLVLLFLVANNYNGDSLGIYDSYVQAGEGNEYVMPVFGEARHIRSDEWGNVTPNYMSTRYLDSIFEKNNYLTRGANSINEYAITWYSVYDPFNFVSAFLRRVIGFERAYSFKWYSRLIFTFLINIEFFLILTRRNKLLSFAATSMICFSSFYMWWYFPDFVTAVPSIMVCVYYFINCKTNLLKYVWSAGIAISAAFYALNLYPAWQVPSGYLMIPIFVWLIYEYKDIIKSWKIKQWMSVVVAVVLFAAICIGYITDRSGYVSAMVDTVYPGKRFSTGGFSLQKIFNYFPAGLFPYKGTANPSAEGICISLFPLPIIFSIYYQIRNKFKNVLINGLLIYSGILTVYTTIGFTEWIAKYTLMSYVPGTRAAEVLAYSEVILFSALFSLWNEKEAIKIRYALPISLTFVVIGLFCANKRLPQYMTRQYIFGVGIVFFAIVFFMICRLDDVWRKRSYVMLIVYATITGLYVRPIEKGLDAVYSKPVYREVRSIMDSDPDAKWMTQGLCLSGYMTASGASCIDFCNKYPNFELWGAIDPTGEYYDCYNRFAYVSISFTDENTSMTNPKADTLSVNLSYKDIWKTGVDYVASNTPLDIDNDYVRFDCIYDKSGIYLYKIYYYDMESFLLSGKV